MDTIGNDTEARIAERIRYEREARGWSLADLAARSSVSKAAISKIERRDNSPTAGNLVKIAGAFDLTLAGLLLRAEGEMPRLVRHADQAIWRDPETGYLRRQMFVRPDHPVEIARIELPAGQSVTLPASSYAFIRQVVLMVAGELTITEGSAEMTLFAGDSLGFGVPADVTFSNQSGEGCTYLVVLSRS
ncbi:helix-turn-helix domain-containing protein [Rhizobium lusitanum]|uniref:Helix-turn-helix domain-containing protein n=2 Tax=Rhizobium lusitanum TaxID=293958 RepID=A0A6L9UG82_9HYPH|nr:helix-turn-helix domain-containing protein [Rhizobium lusitanum]NEI74389.1 helix-turn-helix domain-containing protein [Rhizobium lusitanum]